MLAIGFVASVLTHEVNEIRRRDACDRYQAAKIHQQASIAVEDDDLSIRKANRKSKSAGRRLSHCANRKKVQWMWRNLYPFEGRRIHRHNERIATRRGNFCKAICADHHSAILLPKSMPTGR